MQLQERFAALAGGSVLAACALMILAGCHVQPTLTLQQAEGKQVYDVGCAHCHELNDLALKKVPPNLHGLFSRSKLPDGEPATDAEVERIVLTGKGKMPSFTYQLTREQMASLLAYLHTGMHDEPNR
jgi:mono/diheme cytochrome c family protein